MPTTEKNTAEKALEEITRRILRLETLQTRHSDRLDFPEVAVWALREALEAAYQAGLEAR